MLRSTVVVTLVAHDIYSYDEFLSQYSNDNKPFHSAFRTVFTEGGWQRVHIILEPEPSKGAKANGPFMLPTSAIWLPSCLKCHSASSLLLTDHELGFNILLLCFIVNKVFYYFYIQVEKTQWKIYSITIGTPYFFYYAVYLRRI